MIPSHSINQSITNKALMDDHPRWIRIISLLENVSSSLFQVYINYRDLEFKCNSQENTFTQICTFSSSLFLCFVPNGSDFYTIVATQIIILASSKNILFDSLVNHTAGFLQYFLIQSNQLKPKRREHFIPHPNNCHSHQLTF